MSKPILLVIMLIITSGCTPSVNQVEPYNYYTLQYQHSANKAAKPLYDFVKIDLPHTSSKRMTENIVYSEKPYQKNSYSQNKWKEPLPVMFQEWLVQSIDEMNLFKGVLRVASRANVPLMLETDIVKFEHVLYKNEVDISLRVILIQYNKRHILQQKLFNYRIKVAQPSAESAVIAFNNALIEFDRDLYQWLK